MVTKYKKVSQYYQPWPLLLPEVGVGAGGQPDQAVEAELLPLPQLPDPGPGDAGHGVPDAELEHLGPGAGVSFAGVHSRVAPVHHQQPQLQHARLGIPVELKIETG